jgi:hypothetical protein
MIKSLALSIVLLSLAYVATAQPTAVETTFAKNKPKYTREHLAMGEDASSGYDYLFYKDGQKIVMLRTIWSASYAKELRVEDIYVDEGVVLIRRGTTTKRNLGALKRGRAVALMPREELHFTASKLTRWVENGNVVTIADKRWAETERSSLEHAKSELDSYSWLKENN